MGKLSDSVQSTKFILMIASINEGLMMAVAIILTGCQKLKMTLSPHSGLALTASPLKHAV